MGSKPPSTEQRPCENRLPLAPKTGEHVAMFKAMGKDLPSNRWEVSGCYYQSILP